MPADFVIVRHGATEWSANGRHTGRTDLALTEAGEHEVATLPCRLAVVTDCAAAAIFVSPLQRARQTAIAALGDEVVGRWTVDEALAEWDYGNYEGLLTHEIDALSPGWELFDHGAAGGESVGDVVRRCDGFIERAAMVDAPAVIAFCHGHLSRVLTCRLLGLDGTHARLFRNDTASIAVVSTRRGSRFLAAWNLRP